MKKSALTFLMITALLGSLLTACGSNNDKDGNVPPTSTSSPSASNPATPEPTPEPSKEPEPKPDESKQPGELNINDLLTEMIEKFDQPVRMEMDDQMLKDMYYLDPSILAEYAVQAPMVNIKTNELGIFRLKDQKDLDALKEGIEKRAKDIQKSFESYLPDQYENAKKFRIVTEGEYVFFIISESADELEAYFKDAVAK